MSADRLADDFVGYEKRKLVVITQRCQQIAWPTTSSGAHPRGDVARKRSVSRSLGRRLRRQGTYVAVAPFHLVSADRLADDFVGACYGAAEYAGNPGVSADRLADDFVGRGGERRLKGDARVSADRLADDFVGRAGRRHPGPRILVSADRLADDFVGQIPHAPPAAASRVSRSLGRRLRRRRWRAWRWPGPSCVSRSLGRRLRRPGILWPSIGSPPRCQQIAWPTTSSACGRAWERDAITGCQQIAWPTTSSA